GLSPIKSSIEKVRNLVKAISGSSSLTQELKELGQSVGEGEATPLIRRNNNLSKYKLTPQEESDLQATTKFLHPFYETTNVLSGSTYKTLGISIILTDDIVDTVLSYIQNSTGSEFLEVAATQMSDKIQ
ncbi:1604_t:CDS:2, partial [Gigaspora margarita]